MKRILTVAIDRKSISKLMVSAAILIAAMSPGSFFAQGDSTKTKSDAKEEPTTVSPSLEFYTVQKGNNTIDLRARLQGKVNGANKKLPHLKVNFMSVNGDEEKLLGFGITDVNGKAVCNLKSELVPTDEKGNVNLKAIYAGTKLVEGAEEELTIRKARLEITPVTGDTVYSVKVKLVDVSTGTVTPVPETALGIFVHRYFNPLKVAEATTDESGEGTAVVPFELPGDKEGNIEILVKLDEHELYGFMESSVTQKWGIPLEDQLRRTSRALWTAHPPLWMLITFIILITLVWGHYIVIIWELFRLRKEEPHIN
ncbi:MAG: hypothetical protein PSX36_06330 [bacterium]|nr:hypothetical protein [bacterium]